MSVVPLHFVKQVVYRVRGDNLMIQEAKNPMGQSMGLNLLRDNVC